MCVLEKEPDLTKRKLVFFSIYFEKSNMKMCLKQIVDFTAQHYVFLINVLYFYS